MDAQELLLASFAQVEDYLRHLFALLFAGMQESFLVKTVMTALMMGLDVNSDVTQDKRRDILAQEEAQLQVLIAIRYVVIVELFQEKFVMTVFPQMELDVLQIAKGFYLLMSVGEVLHHLLLNACLDVETGPSFLQKHVMTDHKIPKDVITNAMELLMVGIVKEEHLILRLLVPQYAEMDFELERKIVMTGIKTME